MYVLGGMVITKEEKYAEMAAYVDAEVIPAVLEPPCSCGMRRS